MMRPILRHMDNSKKIFLRVWIKRLQNSISKNFTEFSNKSRRNLPTIPSKKHKKQNRDDRDWFCEVKNRYCQTTQAFFSLVKLKNWMGNWFQHIFNKIAKSIHKKHRKKRWKLSEKPTWWMWIENRIEKTFLFQFFI